MKNFVNPCASVPELCIAQGRLLLRDDDLVSEPVEFDVSVSDPEGGDVDEVEAEDFWVGVVGAALEDPLVDGGGVGGEDREDGDVASLEVFGEAVEADKEYYENEEQAEDEGWEDGIEECEFHDGELL